MRLYPVEPVISDTAGFREDLDIFERKAFGERLEGLFANIEDPLVAVLDAPWGSGKTTFIKMWCGHMRNKGFPVVYFDAFKNDYEEDAFLAIAGEVVALAKKYEQHGVKRSAFVEAAARCGNVLGAAFKGGVKKVASKVIGEAGVEEVCEAAMKDGAEQAIDDAHKYLVEKLESRNKEKCIVDDFRSALESIAESMNNAALQKYSVEGASKRPLVFIIDELDRCKPPFALDIIERIKHYFSVPNVHFLLVTNLKGLELYIDHVYGLSNYASTYLQKFYNVCIAFDTYGDYENLLKISWQVRHLFSFDGCGIDPEHIEMFNELSMLKRIDLRTTEKIATQLIVANHSCIDRSSDSISLLISLCFIKVIDRALFEQLKIGKANFNEVLDFFGLDVEIGNLDFENDLIKLYARYLLRDADYDLYINEIGLNTEEEAWLHREGGRWFAIATICGVIDSFDVTFSSPTP